TWQRLCTEVEGVTGREAQIDAARAAFAQGFIAGAIGDYLREACVMDASGQRHKGVLTGQDMAGWRASYEPVLGTNHANWRIFKGGFWSQGPVQLQVLDILAGDPLAEIDPLGPDFVHLTTEALKLAFADREAYYGDAADIPAARLLSPDYAAKRRAQIGERASPDLRPG